MKKAILFVRRPIGYTFDEVRTTSQPAKRGDGLRAAWRGRWTGVYDRFHPWCLRR